MSGQNNQVDGGQDLMLGVGFGGAALAVAGWAVWYFYGDSIAYYVMYLRYYQALAFTNVSASARAAVAYITTTPADQVSPVALIELSTAALRYWSFVVAGGFALVYWRLRSNSSAWIVKKFRRFGTGNNLEDLISVQSREWKTILPITVDNPADESDEEVQRLYAQALHPEEWLEQNGVALSYNGIDMGMTLFIISAPDQTGKPLFTLDHLAVAWGDGRIPIDEKGHADPSSVRKFIDQYRPKLLPELRATPRAIRHRGKDFLIDDNHLVGCVCLLVPVLSALTRQFQATWNGFGVLPPHTKVLAAAMLYRGAVERVMCHNMLLEIAEIWTAVRIKHKGKGTWKLEHFHEALLQATPLMEMSRHAFNLANGASPASYIASIPDQQVRYMTRDKAVPPAMCLRRIFSPKLFTDFQAYRDGIFPRAKDMAARRKRLTGLVDRLREGRRICDGHSFQETALVSLYDWSKKKGSIMATAEFVWLRAADRPLWYVLNSNGRPKPFIEAAGIHAHWIAETDTEAPLQIPQVAQALRGTVEYFYDKWADAKGM